MIFGDINKFAIECLDIREVHDKYMKWYYGKVLFRIGDQIIGDNSCEETINSIAKTIKQMYTYKTFRESIFLYSLSNEEAIRKVYDALYKDDDRTIEQIKMDSNNYIKYIGLPLGFDAYTNWKVILIEKEKSARYIWMHNEETPKESYLDYGEFDTVLANFLKWADDFISVI